MARSFAVLLLALCRVAHAEAPDAGAAMAVEEFTPAVEAFVPPDAGAAVERFEAPAPSGVTARVYGTVAGLASVDTQWESPPKVDMAENVAELHFRATLGVDVKVNEHLRM